MFNLLTIPLLLLFSTTNLSTQEKTLIAEKKTMKYDITNMSGMGDMAGIENMEGMLIVKR
jgi:hypothetical protein